MGLKETKMKKGFTLIELLVVVAIMVILSTAMVLNLSKGRAEREIKIVQNQLATNLRKVGSYVLSSRTLTSGESVQYYLIKFDLTKPRQYTIQALYNTNTSPQYLQDVETIYLPVNVRLSPTNPVTITRSIPPTTQNPSACGLVAIAAPFGKVLLNDGCTQGGVVGNPSTVGSSSSTDDYKKIIDFVKNTDCVGSSPPICSVSTDSTMTITLTTTDGKFTKTVTLNGITGAVTFN